MGIDNIGSGGNISGGFAGVKLADDDDDGDGTVPLGLNIFL